MRKDCSGLVQSDSLSEHRPAWVHDFTRVFDYLVPETERLGGQQSNLFAKSDSSVQYSIMHDARVYSTVLIGRTLES